MGKTAIFIAKAKAAHGDKYDYSKSVYVKSKEKLTIVCRKHGDFLQRPNDHLMGHGCRLCAKPRSSSNTAEFKSKARAVHGGRYSYDKSRYTRSIDPVLIGCNEHGYFEQIAAYHLSGNGCPKCAGQGLDTSDFIANAIARHGGRYTYEKAKYTGYNNEVTITCKKHGDFEQVAYYHTQGSGCPRCAHGAVLEQSEFISRVVAAHGDRYDLSHISYSGIFENVTVGCKDHGLFEKMAGNLAAGGGCPRCPSRRSEPTNVYLLENGRGSVKIGYAIDIPRRMAEVRRQAPFKVSLLKSWVVPDTPTAEKVERAAHIKAAPFSSRFSGFDGATEWFDITEREASRIISNAINQAGL